jgi:predicted nucleic acid-binding protein
VKLVIDASVAVKWFVEEQGHEDALAILRRGDECSAPDLIVTEVTGALDKKIKANMLTPQHAIAAIRSLQEHLSLLPSTSYALPALELASELHHPVADCIYAACAMDTQAHVVTADTEFVRKAAKWGYQALVRQLGQECDAYASFIHLTADQIADLEKLAYESQAVFENVRNLLLQGKPDTMLGRLIHSSQLAPAFDSPNYRKLKLFIDTLEPKMRHELLALCWLGSGYSGDNWADLVERASQSELDDPTHTPYIISKLHYLNDGFNRLKTLSKIEHDR